MVLIIQKIKASTLQETIIALTVVLISFSTALMVFVNVLNTERAWERLNSNLLIKQISTETKLNKTFFDERIDHKQFYVEKTITTYYNNKDLLQLKLKVFTFNERLINQYNELLVYY